MRCILVCTATTAYNQIVGIADGKMYRSFFRIEFPNVMTSYCCILDVVINHL